VRACDAPLTRTCAWWTFVSSTYPFGGGARPAPVQPTRDSGLTTRAAATAVARCAACARLRRPADAHVRSVGFCAINVPYQRRCESCACSPHAWQRPNDSGLQSRHSRRSLRRVCAPATRTCARDCLIPLLRTCAQRTFSTSKYPSNGCERPAPAVFDPWRRPNFRAPLSAAPARASCARDCAVRLRRARALRTPVHFGYAFFCGAHLPPAPPEMLLILLWILAFLYSEGQVIEVLSASYGANCNPANQDNIKSLVATQCDGTSLCFFRPCPPTQCGGSGSVPGCSPLDMAAGCSGIKEVNISWKCGSGPALQAYPSSYGTCAVCIPPVPVIPTSPVRGTRVMAAATGWLGGVVTLGRWPPPAEKPAQSPAAHSAPPVALLAARGVSHCSLGWLVEPSRFGTWDSHALIQCWTTKSDHSEAFTAYTSSLDSTSAN